MKKSKGFTLIELLAVIVILAVIALIVTPVITGIIDDARSESNKRSVEGYAEAINYALIKNQLSTQQQYAAGTYYTESIASAPAGVTNKLTGLTIDFKGPKVECDKIVIKSNAVESVEGCKVGDADKITSKFSLSGTVTGWN